MKRTGILFIMAALCCLLLAGCEPSVQTDYPRDKIYEAGETIHVYEMDTGDLLLSLTPVGAAVYSDEEQIWDLDDGVNSDGEAKTKPITIRQQIAITFTYELHKDATEPSFNRFHFYSAAGESGREAPEDSEIEVSREGDTVTLVLRVGFETPTDTLRIDYYYGVFTFSKTASISLPVEGVFSVTAPPSGATTKRTTTKKTEKPTTKATKPTTTSSAAKPPTRQTKKPTTTTQETPPTGTRATDPTVGTSPSAAADPSVAEAESRSAFERIWPLVFLLVGVVTLTAGITLLIYQKTARP